MLALITATHTAGLDAVGLEDEPTLMCAGLPLAGYGSCT
jgi:hypothetical protein